MITVEQRAAIARLLREGRPYRHIARQVDVSEATVRRMARQPADAQAPLTPGIPRAGALAARVLAAEPPPIELPPPPEDDGEERPTLEGLLSYMWSVVKSVRRVAEGAERAGNLTTAQRALRDLGQLSPTIVRLEKLMRADSDAIRITPEEYAAARERIAERLLAIHERGPIRCAACARELSIDLAGARAKVEESEEKRRLKAK